MAINYADIDITENGIAGLVSSIMANHIKVKTSFMQDILERVEMMFKGLQEQGFKVQYGG